MKGAHPHPPEDLMAYLDGEVNGEEASSIQAHLAGCDACQRLVADLRNGSAQMKEWRIGTPPASLVAPRSRHSNGPQRSWFFRPLPLLAGAAVTVLIAAALVVRWPLQRAGLFADALSRADASREMPETIIPNANAAPMRLGGQQGVAGAAAFAQGAPAAPSETGPRIVRTATLRVVASDFDRIRPAIDRILQGVGGFVGDISAYDRPGSARSIRGTLRIPNAQFSGALAQLRALGRVTEDSQNAEDVTATMIDLDARLGNSRVTERRLNEVLQNRTGRVADVLEVEREIARVRSEIEQMEVQRAQLGRRVEYGTVTLEVTEEQPAAVTLGPVPVPTRLRHAIADGIEAAAMSMLDATLLLLRAGPVTLLWILVVGLPAWWIFRRTVRAT